MKTAKRIMLMLSITALLCCLLSVAAFAAGSGDVAGAVESTWTAASGQIKSVVNKVVFPAIDMILAKCGMERYHLEVKAPTHKAVLFGSAGGR